MRAVRHHLRDRRMRHLAEFHRTHAIDVVIEPLEREAMQVDEIPRHVKAHRIAPVLAFQRAQDEAVDQQRGAIAFLAARDQPLAVLQRQRPRDQTFEFGLLGIGHVVPQAPGQEPSGLGIAVQLVGERHRVLLSTKCNAVSAVPVAHCINVSFAEARLMVRLPVMSFNSPIRP